ncbi:alpha/beta hydrolase [Micrococcaceae bacterium RIT802]|nr:alpha/beta hydrolase [Micrococcaceae bacterium RIT 802]
MADVVLVHGTTQSSAGFDGVQKALGNRAVRSFAVDIPGAGAPTSAAYAELLAAQVPDDFHRPIIVAHSASGLLLPALARRLDASHQVWFAAAVGDYAGGRSLLAEIQADPTAVLHAEWIGVDPSSDPVLATYFLFHDADLATLRQAMPTVSSCDLSAIYAEVPTEDPARLPSTYVLPIEDRTLQGHWMASVAQDRLRGELIRVHGSHNFYVADPEQAADIISAAAGQAET